MYNGTGVGVGAATAGAVGFGYFGVNLFSILWLVLAAFALLGAGMALGRMLPRRQA